MALKIYFYIRPHKIKKNGEAPIYLSLTGHQRKELSTGYSIELKRWVKARYQSKGKKRAETLYGVFTNESWH